MSENVIISNLQPFMNLIRKEDGEFKTDVKSYIPSEGEIRLIANRNREC